MRRKLSRASSRGSPGPPSTRAEILVRAVRAALLAAIGFFLAYALYLYYIGIFFRVRPSPYRLMLPGLFLLGVVGICYGVFRQILRIRRDIIRLRSEEEKGKSAQPEEADGK